jgi:hypothetical protein
MTTHDPNQQPKRITPEVARKIHDAVLRGGEPDYSTRFQKGQSGNPDGRPSKNSKSDKASRHDSKIAAQAAEIARRTIASLDSARNIDAVEASLLQLRRLAAAGNVPAIRLLFELVGQHEAAEKARQLAEDQEWERRTAHWAAYVAQTRPIFEAAAAKGQPAPAIWPHPDDLVFEDNRVNLIGPMSAEGEALCQETVARADYWIAHMAYDQWRGGRGCPLSAQPEYVYVMDMLFWQDQAWLPPRMQLTDAEVASKLMHYRTLSGRALHRKLSELGRAHKMYVPPWRMRSPLTVPRKAWEIARRNGIGILELLEKWVSVLGKDQHTLRAELAALEDARG